ncbi:dTDP-4-dehydrorhamnose 3,5-epimerase [Beijerinckiaceae bacterium RH AL1]|nr:dTDP-4-dehydrorhamnose 3,5-epimerase [Beijerinckiaceae bacterium]VVB42770.1 dTDP-4-dehydrorhamnose 3,5-epimerase [Beijerinckiaceae bacterium RH AL8]VVB42781.1 dTDP-4-dehydrorhamnose 3,5-epimerase [Beijerinckiaceae bacterium RH CH11]VVC53494.1 dTDP-4-dehydrorhamnose 3,5-epimerase [Beijerinckiaceae bacterium RH AL1]
MTFEETDIAGVWRVGLSPHIDERGFFARTFCSDEFAAHGLPAHFEQSSLSRNTAAGTLRGMHYQAAPHAEAKFVRCVRGSIFDVAVDLRPDSPTRGRWVGETLSAENGLGLYLAPGLAHGFQTLEDDSDVLYQITPAFRAGHGAGVRWNDPAFGITWPLPAQHLSERDATYPDWAP